LSSSSYIAAHIPEYPVIELYNREASADDRVYLLGTGNTFFYFDRPVIARGYYSANEVISWLRSDTTPRELTARFAALGVTYLLVHKDRLTSTLRAVLTPGQVEVWNEFSKESLVGVASAGEISLWRIRPAGTAVSSK
jgi:hypothetical protein